jgi:hypothetical protein
MKPFVIEGSAPSPLERVRERKKKLKKSYKPVG